MASKKEGRSARNKSKFKVQFIRTNRNKIRQLTKRLKACKSDACRQSIQLAMAAVNRKLPGVVAKK